MSEQNPTLFDAPKPKRKRGPIIRSTLPKNLKGLRLGQLDVLGPAPWAAGHCTYWYVRCDCGTEKALSDIRLRYGSPNTCGCLQREVTGNRSRGHGRTGTPEYRSWVAMRTRCTNPNQRHYADYGGRGIKVCPEWDSFERFFADMGPMPGPGYSIDRIDNAKGYEPGNCRWATTMEQAANRRRNYHLTYNGETKMLREWSETLGIPYGTLYERMKRGLSPERIFAVT